MSKQINVCVTYNMSKSQWDSAENCICTSISEKLTMNCKRSLNTIVGV